MPASTTQRGSPSTPVARRIYWANTAANTISFAKLDGSGGGDLDTGGATVSDPVGVAVDPAAGLIYWANSLVGGISFARLDGGGGADLNTAGATKNFPVGVAVDPTIQRAWWANKDGNKISFANLNGSGGGDLATPNATVAGAAGVAVDPGVERIYWANVANFAPGISFAGLDGSGGGDLNTGSAATNVPIFPALLKAPVGTGPPVVTGDSATGSMLSCSTGDWAPDLSPAVLFRAPQRFAYQWSLNGTPLAAATASTLRTDTAGDYRCVVTATNQAGSTTQTSLPFTLTGAGTSTPPDMAEVGVAASRRPRPACPAWRPGRRPRWARASVSLMHGGARATGWPPSPPSARTARRWGRRSRSRSISPPWSPSRSPRPGPGARSTAGASRRPTRTGPSRRAGAP
jgi:hypothetical protein